MKKIQFASLVCLLLVLAACGTSGTAETTDTKQLELSAQEVAKLVVDHRNGTISMRSDTSSDYIQVEAGVRSNGASMKKLELDLRADHNIAYLDARFEGQFLATGSGAVDLEVTVPKGVDVEIKSHRDGDITLNQLQSSASIDNINGDIFVSGLSGSLEIDNRDGNVTVTDIAETVIIDNLNGHVAIERIDGAVEIHVGDGSLAIDQVKKDVTITQTGKGEVSIGEINGNVVHKK